MAEYAYGVYEAIVEHTASELILFFIIVAIAMIPLYYLMLKGRKADRQHDLDREQQIIKVIQENSVAISANTAVIAGLQTNLADNGASIGKALDRIHDRLNGHGTLLTNVVTDIAQINVKIS